MTTENTETTTEPRTLKGWEERVRIKSDELLKWIDSGAAAAKPSSLEDKLEVANTGTLRALAQSMFDEGWFPSFKFDFDDLSREDIIKNIKAEVTIQHNDYLFADTKASPETRILNDMDFEEIATADYDDLAHRVHTLVEGMRDMAVQKEAEALREELEEAIDATDELLGSLRMLSHRIN